MNDLSDRQTAITEDNIVEFIKHANAVLDMHDFYDPPTYLVMSTQLERAMKRKFLPWAEGINFARRRREVNRRRIWRI